MIGGAQTGYAGQSAQRAEQIRRAGRALILAIETSCDETAAAVVRDGREVLSSAVYSQIPIHEQFGGVVPELASRSHAERLPETVARALREAGASFRDLDAVAVTAHPGLVGALLAGVSYAKGIALALGLPLIGVDHIAGHIAANYICHPGLRPPFIALVASGSHSHLFEVRSYTGLRLLGRTRDDAAGEAFDKVARVLGLGYPGGPKLERLAREGNPHAYKLPIGIHGDHTLDVSFSGLKTAVINLLHQAEQKGEQLHKADVAASFQYSLIESLAQKTAQVLREHAMPAREEKTFVLAGGVSANRALRERLRETAAGEGAVFYAPAPELTGDNAAMIGCAGYYALLGGEQDMLSLNAAARNEYNS